MSGDAETEDLDARAHRGAVIIPSIFFAFLAVLYLAVGLRGGGYTVLLVVIAGWALMLSYVLSYRVVVSSGRLRKTTLFGTTDFSLTEIRTAAVRTGIPRGLEVLLPPTRLEIEHSHLRPKVIINLKMLRRSDINKLLRILGHYTQVAGGRSF